MSKMFDAVKRVSEIVKQRFNSYQPTGKFQEQINVEAQEAVIDSQVGNVSTNEIHWSQWVIINQWANYFANRFKYKTIYTNINNFINTAIRASFIYGTISVVIINRTAFLCYVQERGIEYSRISLIHDISQEFRAEDKQNQYIKVKSDSIIDYKFDSLGFSAFLILQPIIKAEQQIQKSFMNELIALPTRVIHDVSVGGSLKNAQKFVKMNAPVITRVNGGSDSFEGLALNSNSSQLIELIEYQQNYYYQKLGRRTNTEYKASHLLGEEIQQQEIQFIVLERDRLLHLKSFLQKLSAKIKQDILLETEEGDLKNVWS